MREPPADRRLLFNYFGIGLAVVKALSRRQTAEYGATVPAGCNARGAPGGVGVPREGRTRLGAGCCGAVPATRTLSGRGGGTVETADWETRAECRHGRVARCAGRPACRRPGTTCSPTPGSGRLRRPRGRGRGSGWWSWRRIDQGAIRRLQRSRSGAVRRKLEQRTDRVADIARAEAPGSMGPYIRSHAEEAPGELQGVIVCDHPKVRFVLDGTRPTSSGPGARGRCASRSAARWCSRRRFSTRATGRTTSLPARCASAGRGRCHPLIGRAALRGAASPWLHG